MKELLRADRLKHFILGDAITFFLSIVFIVFFALRLWEVCVLSFSIVLIIAFGKEAYDGGSEQSFFDKIDIKATMLGCLFALLKIVLIILFL
jgi:hypothetical protein